MYRYYLFYYEDYYPHGGMNDCKLKTNNFNDLEQYIRQNYECVWYTGTIAYYDAAEDKYMYADFELDEDEIWRFAGWEEKE